MNIFYPVQFRLLLSRLAYPLRLMTELLVLAILLGLAMAKTNPGTITQATTALGPIVELLSQLTWWQMIGIIFLNNTLTIALATFGGVMLGILPILFLVLNGYLIGVVIWLAAAEQGVAVSLAAILPHGLLEIGILILAAALGLHLGQLAWASWQQNEWLKLKNELKTVGRLFLTLILPALAIAAVIEILITPVVVTWICPDCLSNLIDGSIVD